MPRRSAPRSRHRHSRSHVRFHRDRIVQKRGRQFRKVRYPWWSTPAFDREELEGPWGFLEDEQAWLGCGCGRNGMCRWGQRESKRERRQEDRFWSHEWWRLV